MESTRRKEDGEWRKKDKNIDNFEWQNQLVPPLWNKSHAWF